MVLVHLRGTTSGCGIRSPEDGAAGLAVVFVAVMVVELALLVSVPVTANAAGGSLTAYITTSGSNTVTPIDLATNTSGNPIAVGDSPDGIAITPNGAAAYVADISNNTVTPINLVTNTPGSPVPVGRQPSAVAITPDGSTAYVTNSGSATVTPITVATTTPGTPIPDAGKGGFAIAITPDGKAAYVANDGTSTVTPIDLATNTSGTPVRVAPIKCRTRNAPWSSSIDDHVERVMTQTATGNATF